MLGGSLEVQTQQSRGQTGQHELRTFSMKAGPTLVAELTGYLVWGPARRPEQHMLFTV